jgi:hypothetical protein
MIIEINGLKFDVYEDFYKTNPRLAIKFFYDLCGEYLKNKQFKWCVYQSQKNNKFILKNIASSCKRTHDFFYSNPVKQKFSNNDLNSQLLFEIYLLSDRITSYIGSINGCQEYTIVRNGKHGQRFLIILENLKDYPTPKWKEFLLENFSDYINTKEINQQINNQSLSYWNFNDEKWVPIKKYMEIK